MIPCASFEVVAQAQDGAEAVRCVLDTGADLAVLDISMPRVTGLAAAREITQRRPQTRVLMLSMHDNEQYFFETLKAALRATSSDPPRIASSSRPAARDARRARHLRWSRH